ncbi:uncharacterized protein LOC131994641 [Stomoxys calcitrans]|uniref:uncharacterized protein LOC131994641 n=1 Tax=Stomoxys calcitrans TaxID=35570 RepID=UPI0027E26B33|nr:uncharacterized protein LOC131994641 [Stomoxys calcitrans]
MASTEEHALQKVYYLTHDATKNWRKLLKYGETLDVDVKRKLLWMWPTEKCLQEINELLQKFNITCLLSIGCGSGLFEWLLKESSNIEIHGLEVDRKWWSSSYAIKSFIQLKYIEDMCLTNNDYLQDCCSTNSWNFVLMFCYFNNRQAFLEYLNSYQGNWLIIIGPLDKQEIYTDPLPLEPNFPSDMLTKWLLKSSLEMGENDCLAIYEKIELI